MRRRIVTRVIDMHKRSVHNGHRLEEISEHFTQIVAVFQGRAGGQDNVDFDEQLIAGVVGTQILDLADGCGESHGEVQEEVSLVGLGGESGQVADVVGGGLGPGDDDHHGQ